MKTFKYFQTKLLLMANLSKPETIDDIIKTTKKIDYKISRVKKDSVLLKINQQIKGPVSIYGLNKDSVVFEKWIDGFEGKKWVSITSPEKITKLKIDYRKQIPELYHGNNAIRSKGILKKTKPFKLRMISPIEEPDYNQINILPVAGWNYYNKFMLGAIVHNGMLPIPLPISSRFRGVLPSFEISFFRLEISFLLLLFGPLLLNFLSSFAAIFESKVLLYIPVSQQLQFIGLFGF